VFEGRQMRTARVVLLVRGVLKGESAASLVWEVGMSRTTITELRQLLQANASRLQADTALRDNVVETDEMFQNAGEKGMEYFDPFEPPRCRANKRRGRGTFASDRPPVLGVMGRETGQVRLRVVDDPRMMTLCSFVESFTQPDTLVYTDEYQSHNDRQRVRESMCHGVHEWARDGDGWFETLKACGRLCAISCVPFVVSASIFYMLMSLSMNSTSISRPFRLLLSLLSFTFTPSEHEPLTFIF
jgi:transposase